MAITRTGGVGLWFCGFLCPGTPEGSTGSGSGFKSSQKTEPRLKASSDRLGEAEIEPATLGLQDIGLSPTPRRLQFGALLIQSIFI